MKNLCLVIIMLCLVCNSYAQNTPEFTADKTSVCAGERVTFTSSTTDADQYIWTLPGTREESITTTEPTVTATYSGSPEDRTQDVSLTTVKDDIENSATLEDYIEVGPDFLSEVTVKRKELSTDCDRGTTFEIKVTNSSPDIGIEVNGRQNEDNIFEVTCPYYECDLFIRYFYTNGSCEYTQIDKLNSSYAPKYDYIYFNQTPLYVCVGESIHCNPKGTIMTRPDAFTGEFRDYSLELQSADLYISGQNFTADQAGTYELTYIFKYKDCEEVYTRSVIVVDEIEILANTTTFCVGEPVEFRLNGSSNTDFVDSNNAAAWLLNDKAVSWNGSFEYTFEEVGNYRLEALFCNTTGVLEFEVKANCDGNTSGELTFEADKTSVCAGDMVTFTSSTTDADQYIWTLPGTREESITTTEPTVTATYSGSPEDRTQDVSLTTVKDDIENTTSIQDYIRVAPNFFSEVSVTIEEAYSVCGEGTTFTVSAQLEAEDIIILLNGREQTNNTFEVTCPTFTCDLFIDYKDANSECSTWETKTLYSSVVPKYDYIWFTEVPFLLCPNEEVHINRSSQPNFTYIQTSPNAFATDYSSPYTVEVEGEGLTISEDGLYFSASEPGNYTLNYHFKYGSQCADTYSREVIVVEEMLITTKQTEYCVGDTVHFQVTDIPYLNSVNMAWSINGNLLGAAPQLEYIITEAGLHQVEALFCNDPVYLEFEAQSCQTTTAIEPTTNGIFNWNVHSLPFQNTKQIELEGLKGSENIDLNIYTVMGQKIQTTSLQPTENQTVEIPHQYANSLLIMELVVDGKYYGGKKCW